MKFLQIIRKNFIIFILIFFLVLWSLGPILWSFIVSVNSEANMISKPPIINFNGFNLTKYKILLTGKTGQGESFRKSFLNSVLVCIIATILNILISTIAGYAFSRFTFFGKRFLFLIIILTMPVPLILIAIPLTKMMSAFNLMDSYIGLSLIYVSLIMPLTTWMSTNYFHTIPKDLEDAASIDGCNRTQIFIKIFLPLVKPLIGSIAIMSFLNSWGQFFMPLIFSSSKTKQLSVFITEFIGKYDVQKGLIAASGIIAIIPPILIVLFFNKFIISGLIRGSIKE